MTYATVEAEIISRLELDPRIRAPEEVAVSVESGQATLRGTVGSLGQRRAAVKDASNALGVDVVHDELKVRLLDEYMRADAEIRGAALQALMWDVEVPNESLDVDVRDGWVTLTGRVAFQFQSDDAFEDVASLIGVVGVVNKIEVGLTSS